MKRAIFLVLALCLLLPALTGCKQELPVFDAAATAAPATAFPLHRVGGLRLAAPQDFSAEEQGNAWYAPTYPADGSCITIHTAATNPQFASYTADNVKQALEASYLASLETEVSVTMDAFEFCTVDGFKALKMEYHFTYRDIKMCCLQYLIQADQAYTVTCIQVAEAKWMTEFATVCESLIFDWETVSPV